MYACNSNVKKNQGHEFEGKQREVYGRFVGRKWKGEMLESKISKEEKKDNIICLL